MKMYPGEYLPQIPLERKEQAIRAARMTLCEVIPARADLSRLLLLQLRYISPFYWLLQLAAFLAAALLAVFWAQEAAPIAKDVLLFIAPATAILGIPELLKSFSRQVGELEMSCRHSVAETFLHRLFVIGLINILVLMSAALVLSLRFQIGFLQTLLAALIPLQAVYIISLLLLRAIPHTRRSSAVMLATLAGAVLALILLLLPGLMPEEMHTKGLVLLLLTGLLSSQLRGILLSLRRKEERFWNSPSTL